MDSFESGTKIIMNLLRYLYAIGGQDGGSCLDLVERYDQANNKWERKASMKTRRLGVGVAVLNEFVYAVGGSDGGKPWDSVEKYNPKNDTWQVGEMKMNSQR